jgi:DNA transformation protein and related proteins
MTAATPAFVSAVVDDLTVLGEVRQRAYFGGVGLVHDGRQGAFIMGNSLYLATNCHRRPAMQASGSQPFDYMTKTGPRIVEAYYDTPPEVLANPDRLTEWARRAMARLQLGQTAIATIGPS